MWSLFLYLRCYNGTLDDGSGRLNRLKCCPPAGQDGLGNVGRPKTLVVSGRDVESRITQFALFRSYFLGKKAELLIQLGEFLLLKPSTCSKVAASNVSDPAHKLYRTFKHKFIINITFEVLQILHRIYNGNTSTLQNVIYGDSRKPYLSTQYKYKRLTIYKLKNYLKPITSKKILKYIVMK